MAQQKQHKVWQKNRIGRNITTTHIRGFFYNAQNLKTGFYKRLWGDYDLERATKEAQKVLGTQRLMVEAVEYSSAFYSMPLETFVDTCDVCIQNDRIALEFIEQE